MNKGDVILWIPCGGWYGFGDRIRGLAATMVLSRELGFPLVVYWPRNRDCPYKLSEMVDVDGCIGFDRGEEDGCQEVPAMLLRHPMNWMPSKSYGCFSGGHLCLYLRSEQEFLTDWKLILREIRDGMQSEQVIANFIKGMFDGRVVGVHLRRTDVMADGGRRINDVNVGEYDRLLLQRVIDEDGRFPGTSFFIASDDPGYAEKWLGVLSAKGLKAFSFGSKWEVKCFRKSGLVGLMGDFVGLSLCDRIFCSVFSSFSYVAAKAGEVKVEHVKPET